MTDPIKSTGTLLLKSHLNPPERHLRVKEKADNMADKGNTRKWLGDGEPSGSQPVTHDGKDNASQFPGKEGSNVNLTSDVEDDKSFGTAE